VNWNNVVQFDVTRYIGKWRWLSGNGLVLRCADCVVTEWMYFGGGVFFGDLGCWVGECLTHTDSFVITKLEGDM
jgi:hypothetical protein